MIHLYLVALGVFLGNALWYGAAPLARHIKHKRAVRAWRRAYLRKAGGRAYLVFREEVRHWPT